jgi:hypothetical protein
MSSFKDKFKADAAGGGKASSFKDKFKAGCDDMSTEDYEKEITRLKAELATEREHTKEMVTAATELGLLKLCTEISTAQLVREAVEAKEEVKLLQNQLNAYKEQCGELPPGSAAAGQGGGAGGPQNASVAAVAGGVAVDADGNPINPTDLALAGGKPVDALGTEKFGEVATQ